MENFFGRLKVEMFYGEKFESVNAFINQLKHYMDYYNNERILGINTRIDFWKTLDIIPEICYTKVKIVIID